MLTKEEMFDKLVDKIWEEYDDLTYDSPISPQDVLLRLIDYVSKLEK